MNKKRKKYLQSLYLTLLKFNLEQAFEEHNKTLDELALALSAKANGISVKNKVKRSI